MPEVFNRHGFGPSVAVKQLSSCSWVDHLRFGSTTSDWSAHFGLAFASPPAQNALGSPLIVTRRLIKQKARHHQLAPALTPCKHMISGTISLRSQRFFSPFPRGTCSLSVANEYLALPRGRGGFTRRFTFSGATFHPLLLTVALPRRAPTTPGSKLPGLGYSAFARRY